MMSNTQVLINRAGWIINHQFSPKNYGLLKFLVCKKYTSSTSRYSCAISKNGLFNDTKVQGENDIPPIPFVSKNINDIMVDKHYVTFSKQNEKFDSHIFIQKSQITLGNKEMLGDVKDLIKTEQADKPSQDPSNKPDPEQIEKVAAVLKGDLVNIFVKQQNYMIYHPNLVFENHIRGTITYTLADYMKQIALLKIVGHLKYAFVEMQVLKLTTHHSEGTIKVRWRIKGLGGMKVFISFWKYKFWNLKETAMKDVEPWYDGFSIFYVKGDGLIHKHVLLKMQPDEDHEVNAIKPSITAKVA